MPRTGSYVLVAACILVLLGCAAHKDKPASDNQHQQAAVPPQPGWWSKTRTYVDDSEITASIKYKFMMDDYLSVFDIKVETKDGIVTLLGHVQKRGDIDRAISLAKSTEGVVDVVNKLVLVFG